MGSSIAWRIFFSLHHLTVRLYRYREVAAFAQFGSDLDASTQFLLNRGARLTELLKQDQYKPMSVEHQVLAIYSGVNGYLDKLPVNKILAYEKALIAHIEANHKDIFETIRKEGKLSDELLSKIKSVVSEFAKSFV